VEEQAFIAAVRADMADLTPRFVFADWLDENGRVDKAAYLRLQSEQSQLLNRDPRYYELAKAKHAVAEKVGRAWCYQVGDPHFRLKDQILARHRDPINDMDAPYDDFSVVVRETQQFVELARIEGKDFPKLPPDPGGIVGRLKKHWRDRGNVLVGKEWWVWRWTVGPPF
jgi:uncharacterized protein (TIGR02996 family)